MSGTLKYLKRLDLWIPGTLHSDLVAVAEREHRSVTAQIVKLLEDGLAEGGLGEEPAGGRPRPRSLRPVGEDG